MPPPSDDVESEQRQKLVEENALEHQKAIAAELERIFTYHAPTPYIAKLHEGWREATKKFATALMELPATRERAMALTRLEETSMWIQACIARNHDQFPEPNPPDDDE